MRSDVVFWVRLAAGLAIALVVPPVLVNMANQSLPVRVEWWMIAIGAVGLIVAPGPRARLLLVLPYGLFMAIFLAFAVAMGRACELGGCP